MESLVETLTSLSQSKTPKKEPIDKDCEPNVFEASASVVNDDIVVQLGTDVVEQVARQFKLNVIKSSSGTLVLVGENDPLHDAKTAIQKHISHMNKHSSISNSSKQKERPHQNRKRRHQDVCVQQDGQDSPPQRSSRCVARLSYSDLSKGKRVLKDPRNTGLEGNGSESIQSSQSKHVLDNSSPTSSKKRSVKKAKRENPEERSPCKKRREDDVVAYKIKTEELDEPVTPAFSPGINQGGDDSIDNKISDVINGDYLERNVDDSNKRHDAANEQLPSPPPVSAKEEILHTVKIEAADENISQDGSEQTLKEHGKQHHSDNYVCDICFLSLPCESRMTRHRNCHFNKDDGSLKESAIVKHKQALGKLGMQENLGPDLAKYIEEYEETKMSSEEFSSKKDIQDEDSHEDETFSGDPQSSNIRDVVRPNTSIDILGKFKCELCSSVLVTQRMYNRHKKMLHGPNRTANCKPRKKRAPELSMHKCPHCEFECMRIQNFQRHLKAHKKPSEYKCDLCSYTNVLLGEVNRHKRNSHSEKNISCDLCSTKFRNKILLNQHIKQKHSNVYHTICEICGLSMTRTAYKTHLKNQHGPNAVENHQRMPCQRCGKMCRSKASYQAHMKKFHPDEDNVEEAEIEDSLIKLPDGVLHNGKQFACKICGFKGRYPRSVVRHIIQVHAARRHHCDKCEAAFPRISLLERHVAVYHDGVERCQCTECGHWFRSKTCLRGHMLRVHLTGLQQRCNICNKGFYLKESLLQHKEHHQPVEQRKDKLYNCEKCSQKFSYKSAYMSHQQEHEGRNLYVCLVCSKTFPSTSDLESHLSTHSDQGPHACSKCGKTFKMRKYLDVHLLAHDTPSFECQNCGREFQGLLDLQRHICSCVVKEAPVNTVVSDGDQTNQYVCTKCGEILANSSTASLHQCEEVGCNVETDNVNSDNFICMACGMQFDDETKANQHMCTETITLQTSTAQKATIAVDGAVILEQADMEDVSELHKYAVTIQNPDATADHIVVDGSPANETQADSFVLKQDPGDRLACVAASGLSQDSMKDSSDSDVLLNQDTMPVYMCGICQKLFLSDEEIDVHVREHENMNDGVCEEATVKTENDTDSSVDDWQDQQLLNEREDSSIETTEVDLTKIKSEGTVDSEGFDSPAKFQTRWYPL